MALQTSIEFTDVQCKIVTAERGKGRLQLRNIVRFSLPRNDDAEARVTERSQLLKDALRNNKLNPKRVQVVIPKNYVMARMVTLPSVEENELKGMARFEAERHIPFNAERHVVAYHVLEKKGVQGSQVMLAAVDQPNAQEYVDICQKAGLLVESIRVSSISAFNAFAHAEKTALDNRVVNIINIGRGYTDLVIVNNGMLSFTRGSSLGVDKLLAELADADPDTSAKYEDLPKMDALEPQNYFRPPAGSSAPAPQSFVDGPDLTNELASPAMPVADPLGISILGADGQPQPTPAVAKMPENKGAIAFTNWLLRLTGEIKRTYEFARREFNCPMIDQIYLCGEGACIRNLAQFLKVNLGIETSVFDPTQSVDLPSKLSAQLDGHGSAYAAAIGALAPPSPQSVDINLLPTEYVERRLNKRQQQGWIITGAMALVALVLAFILVYDMFKRQEELVEFYRGKNLQMRDRVQVLNTKRTRLNLIRQFVQDEHSALDVLERISSFPFIPENVTLQSLNYIKDDQVKVAGYAKTYPHMNEFKAALDKTGFFEKVEEDAGSVKASPLPGRGKETPVYQFSLTAVLKKRDAKPGATGGARPAAADEEDATEEETDGAE